jgi:23S rRNA (adenine-N6)-dimethyltransferase
MDFLRYSLPTKPFSVISNIPFAFTSRILERLLNPNYFMERGIFIVQKEAAEMFIGKDKESFKSLKYFPFWDFEILQNLHKTDFKPSPSVDTVLLKISRKEESLIEKELYKKYSMFLKKIVQDRVGEGIWKQVFTKNQLRQIKNHTELIFGKGIAVQDRYEILGIFKRFCK